MKVLSKTHARRQQGAVNARTLALLGGLVVIAAVLAYIFLWPTEPEIAAPPVEPVAPPATAEERGDTAREVIADLKSGEGDVDYAQAHARAREFHAAGRLADAQLLYFFAARGKYAPAAVELAEMYDPVRFSAAASLMDEPDAFQAYKWYRQALEAGDASADEPLAALKAWADQAAGGGDADAERLLLQWE